jgi:hypothetical protein
MGGETRLGCGGQPVNTEPRRSMFFKVIGCEIAARELYYTAARSRHLIDLELLTQGYHDTPRLGQSELQKRIDAVPAGKYDAILLGYALCSSILAGLRTAHTPLVVPRAHDCITLFLGSKERYQHFFNQRPGTYYFTSGWLEYARRLGDKGTLWGGASVPANSNLSLKTAYEKWLQEYGEERAKFLFEEMSRWSDHYSHGALIHFDFLEPLGLREQARQICADKKWEYQEIQGDLRLFEALLGGNWPQTDFLVLKPGEKLQPTCDEKVIAAAPAP